MINFQPTISLSKTTNYHLIWSYHENTDLMETYEISGLSSLPSTKAFFLPSSLFALGWPWIHLQHKRIVVAVFRQNNYFFEPKTIKKIPSGKCDSYTLMLRINPPLQQVSSKVNLLQHHAPSESGLTSIFRTFNRLCDFKHFQVRFIGYNVKPKVLNFTFLTELNCKNAYKH